jgi:mono/diheme cytochrome c family protein
MGRRITLLAGLTAVALLIAACGDTVTATTSDSPSQTTVDGDPERGRQIWADATDVMDRPCSACHSIDGTEPTTYPPHNAPSWLGISERAGSTVPGVSAEMYLRESILDPGAYVVEGYTSHMPEGYKFLLSEDDVNDLTAFLLTL